MNRVWPLSLLLACAPLAHGQSLKDIPASVNSGDAAKIAEETSRVLNQAKSNNALEAVRSAATAQSSKRMDAVAEKAKNSRSGQPTFAEQTREAESQKRLKDAMSRVSPEGKAILAQNATPAMRAPGDSPVGVAGAKASPLSTDAPGPKPQPLKATPMDNQGAKPPARTVIDAGSSFFDPKANFGVFVDDVVLDHPQFHLNCDELEVYMNKEEEPGAKKEDAPKASGPTASDLVKEGAADAGSQGQAPSERKAGGNIKSAIAKGRKVLITKMNAKGEPQTGIGRQAVYDGATGDMILRGWPQIQEGRNLTVATEPSTYFVIKANGNFQALGGRAQTRIIQEDEKKTPAGQNAAATSGSAPTVPPAPVPNLQPRAAQ